RSLLASDGSEQPLDRIAGKPVAAFCGIGNPAGFRHTLAALDCQVAAWREFPDHHNYSGDDVQSLSQWAQQAGDVGAVVCTQKDLVKIGEKTLGERPLFALAISMDIVSGQDVLEAALEEVLRSVR
ncbi:MAG: tetraacyldisaccharide 4'-kinase, partial [Planctomycetales bacterium]|nr:tetraacyldisaccharide 4'-kinase [Planctomycetales bacterium]